MTFKDTILLHHSTVPYKLHSIPSWSCDFTEECLAKLTSYGIECEANSSNEIIIHDPNIRVYTRPMNRCHYCPEPDMYNPQYSVFYDACQIMHIEATVMNWCTSYSVHMYPLTSHQPMLGQQLFSEIVDEILSYTC